MVSFSGSVDKATAANTFNTKFIHVNYIVVNTYVLHIIRDNIIKIKATEQYVI